MGTSASFEDYVAVRGGALLRVAFLVTGSEHDAEDLCQTVLAKAVLRWERVTQAHDVDAYLRKALLRTWLSWRRRRWHGEQPTLELGDVRLAGDELETSDDRLLLLTALRQLPPGQRAAVVLRHYVDLSLEQTAEELGCSVGAAKAQTSKGLVKLRLLLAEPTPLKQEGRR